MSQTPRPPRRVTAMDVAARAGVSRTTVSYVLNDRPHQAIPEGTRRRVLDAAAELGYAPSAAARTLATGRSSLVLGVIPDWPVSTNLGEAMRALTRAFAAEGLVYLSHTATAAEEDLAPLWGTVSPAATILFDHVPPEQVDRMRAAGIAVVVASWSSEASVPGTMDRWDEEVGRAQAEHLISVGHQRLGYAWPDDERVVGFARPRLAGVRAACAAHGLAPPLVHTVPADAARAGDVVRRWRGEAPPVTAVCAYNDETAHAVLAGLRLLGLAAPADLAVVGVDDNPVSALQDPSLTTVRHDLDALARQVVGLVVGALGEQASPVPSAEDRPPAHLIRRSTT